MGSTHDTLLAETVPICLSVCQRPDNTFCSK